MGLAECTDLCICCVVAPLCSMGSACCRQCSHQPDALSTKDMSAEWRGWRPIVESHETFWAAQLGKRACHWAAYLGSAEALQELLDRRPNLEAKDLGGNTALHLAAAAGHL